MYCCILTNDAGREFGMAQFKCKLSLNIWQDLRAFDPRLGRSVSPNFQSRRVSLRLCIVI